MNKLDYFDLLNDYLRKYYSIEETQEILRDYEEYFINAKLDNKTDAEIIEELGSPKKIVLNLIDEDGRHREGRWQTCRNRFYIWYERRFLTSVQNKLTNSRASESTVLNNFGKLLGFLVKNICLLFLHVVVLIFLGTFLAFLLFLVGITISGILLAVFLTPVTLSGFSFLNMSFLGIIFPIMLAVGLAILMCLIIRILAKFIYRFILEYIHWVKLQMMYKKVRLRPDEDKLAGKAQEV